MNTHVHSLKTPYRAGRFAIHGQASETAESVLLTLQSKTQTRDILGMGEAVPSMRVLGIDTAGIVRQFEAIRNGLQKVELDRDADTPPMLPSGLKGPVACAVDGALLDAWARARQEPLWRAIGLPRPRMPTSATVSLGSPEEMARESRTLLEAGFTHLKVKLGGDDGLDDARIQSVREAAPRAVVRVDANEGWTAKQTIRMSGPLADAGVELVEQPLVRNASKSDHHAVNRALDEHDIPHVLDETVHTAQDAQRIAKDRLAHGVNLKLQKAGGLRAGLELIQAAREGGLKVMVGCFIESWAGISLALQAVARVDWADLDGAWLLAGQPVVPQDPLLEDGVLSASDREGLGIMPGPTLTE